MRKLVVSAAVAVVAIGGGVVVADKGLNDAPPHRHYIGDQEVGPRICDHPGNKGIQNAFNQFHANHHNHNFTGGQGPVAPGLHNGKGPDLRPGPC
jgi:hypothetical protein